MTEPKEDELPAEARERRDRVRAESEARMRGALKASREFHASELSEPAPAREEKKSTPEALFPSEAELGARMSPREEPSTEATRMEELYEALSEATGSGQVERRRGILAELERLARADADRMKRYFDRHSPFKPDEAKAALDRARDLLGK